MLMDLPKNNISLGHINPYRTHKLNLPPKNHNMKKHALILFAFLLFAFAKTASAQTDSVFTGAQPKLKHYDALYAINSGDDTKIKTVFRHIANAMDDERLKGKLHVEL